MLSPVRKAIALALFGATLVACDGGDGDGDGDLVECVPGSSAATPAVTDAPEIELPASAVRTIATGLRIPWGLAFVPNGTALVTERDNQVLARDDPGGVARIMSITPTGTVTAVQRLSEVDLRWGEGGLLGIAVSPNYAADRWVYVYYSTADDNRIARLHLGEPPQPILTGIPVSGDDGRFHQGGRLAFGLDGMLYASVGETYFDSEIAQDRNSLGGKILRMTADGKPAPGNPFASSLLLTRWCR